MQCSRRYFRALLQVQRKRLFTVPLAESFYTLNCRLLLNYRMGNFRNGEATRQSGSVRLEDISQLRFGLEIRGGCKQ
jgi:hypothetical protein